VPPSPWQAEAAQAKRHRDWQHRRPRRPGPGLGVKFEAPDSDSELASPLKNQFRVTVTVLGELSQSLHRKSVTASHGQVRGTEFRAARAGAARILRPLRVCRGGQRDSATAESLASGVAVAAAAPPAVAGPGPGPRPGLGLGLAVDRPGPG
jgi:hypothetical protein